MGTSTDAIFAYGIDLADWSEGEYIDESDNPVAYELTERYGRNKEAQIFRHCSHEYPMYVLIIGSSMIRAARGYIEGFEPEKLTVDPEWREILQKACADAGLEFSEPKWMLMSYWG